MSAAGSKGPSLTPRMCREKDLGSPVTDSAQPPQSSRRKDELQTAGVCVWWGNSEGRKAPIRKI